MTPARIFELFALPLSPLCRLAMTLGLAALAGPVAAEDRYPVLTVNEICLDNDLSHMGRIEAFMALDGWGFASQETYTDHVYVGAWLEDAADALSADVNAALRDTGQLAFAQQSTSFLRDSVDDWGHQVAFETPNDGYLILAEVGRDHALCIFMSKEPRSLMFARDGKLGSGLSRDGVALFRGISTNFGTRLEHIELVGGNSLILLPESLQFRFLGLIQIPNDKTNPEEVMQDLLSRPAVLPDASQARSTND